jgi:PKD repeat protein
MKKLIAALGATTGTWKGWLLSLLVLFAFSQSKAAFVIWADTVSGTSGSQVDISIKVKDFTLLTAAQGTITWNTSVATYNSTQAYNLPGLVAANFGTAQTGLGRLSFSWNDPTASGHSVPNNTVIFKVRFNLVGAGGSSTPVGFNSSMTTLEFADNNFNPVPFSTISGLINVTGAPPSCAISSITAGTQTACVPATNTYTQQVTVTYTNAPGSGTLLVNGQSFAITSSPQTVTLTGLAANGAPVNTTASFSANGACTLTANSLFTAPASCSAAGGNLVIYADTVSGNTGSQVIITVRARNFTNLTSAQGSITWNTSVATYSGIPTFGLPSMTIGNFGTGQTGAGILTFSWNDPTLAGVTVPNGTTLFTVRYNIVGTGGSATAVSFGNAPTPMEFADNNFVNVPFSSNNGRIVVNGVAPGLVIYADTVTGITGGTVDLPVRADDFILLTSAQGSLKWNTSVATYNSIASFGLPGMTLSNFGTGQTAAGRLTFSWNDGTLAGVTLADSAILFTVRYNLVGAGGTFTPDSLIDIPTNLEFVDNNFAVVPFTKRHGRINVIGSGNTITTGTISGSPFCAGATVSVPFTITGVFTGGNVFTAQLSNASGSFASPVNIGTLAGTSSGTITATIPPGTATGSGYRIRVVSSAPSVTGTDNTVNITINAIPATPTISAGGPTTFCAGGSVVLTSSSATGNVWSPGGATTQSITVTTAGTYSVVVTTAGCSSAPSAGTTVTVTAAPAAPTITAGGPTTFCTGGSVTLTSSSATNNVWSPGGQTTQSITVSAAGTYTCVVNNGCASAPSNAITVTVNANPATPTISAGGPTTFCTGGSVVLTSSSPTGNVWTPGGATTQSITATASGSYTVTVTNGSGCSATSAPTVVTVNAAPSAPTITAGGPTTFCAGGSVTLTSNSATNNVWSPGGQTTQSITVSAAGTYTCVVNNGCASPASNAITVTVNPLPSAPSITPGGPTTFCAGGSVTLTSSSASGNLWSPGGATTQSITATTSGSYTVQFTDGNGCSATSAPTVVTVNALPATPTISAGGPTTFCTGGSVVLTSSSPTGNVWSPGGATTQSITATTAGSYTVTVTNGNGCSATSAPTVVTVTAAPAAPTITAGGPTTFCAGGSVTLTSSSATNNVWSPGGQTTQSITVSASGTYTCVVNNGCASPASNAITVTVNANPATPTISAGGPTSFCTGGSVVLTSSSPTGNVWTPGGATTQSITVTTAGSYTVQVTNGSGCSATSAPTVVTVTAAPAAPTITSGGPTTFCAGGTVTLTSSSATNNVWSPGGQTTQSITVSASGTYTCVVNPGCASPASNAITVTVNPLPATPTISAGGPTSFCTGGSVVLTSSSPTGNVWTPGGATTQSITVTTSGSYTVQVTDGNGCSATSAPTVVTVGAASAAPTITAGGPTTFCAGGSVTLTSSSATNNVWSPGGQTTQSITVSAAGTYTCVVNNGCVSPPSNAITVTVNPLPAAPSITPGGPTTFCAGGSVTLTSSSATSNLWSPGGATTQSITATASGSYTVQFTDGNGCSATSAPTVVTVNALPATPVITPGGPTTFCAGGSVVLTSSSATGNLWSPGGATTQSITATAAGSYTVQVTDVNGCSATSAPTVVTVNAAPPAPTISTSGPTTFCQGGSVTLTSSSPTGNIWSPGGQTTPSITVTTPGTYTLVVNNGCPSPPSNAVTVVVNANPPTPVITPSGPTSFCTGGSVTLTSSSTTGNVWSPGGATTQSITVTTAGSYTVQVTNGFGCSSTSAPTTVTVNAAPAAPVITAGGPTTFCQGGTVTLTSSSATNNVWSPGGATTQSITVSASGTYTCVVNNGCASPASNAITVTVNANPATPTITPSGPTTFCTGGSVVLTSSSATDNLWSPGGATTQSITVTTSGSYTVQVSNANGCTATSAPTAVTVNAAPSAPTITAGGPTTFCQGGTVTLTSSSATNNVWSPGGQTTQSITVSAAGTYTCVVNNGCASPASNAITVTVNALPVTPTISAGGPTTFCAGGSVTLTSSSPTGNVWTPGGATSQSITATTSGSYTVQVTNGSGCSATSTATVVTVNPIPATPTITPSGSTAICVGGSVTLTSSSASGNVWSPGGQTTQSITATTAGTYSVTVTTAGCSSAASAPITVTITPAVTAGFTANPTGLTVAFTNTSTNATSYSWNFGDGSALSTVANPTHTYTTGGVFNVCLTATNACGSIVSCQNVTLCVTPTAAFTQNANNLAVAFTDASTGAPTSWAWDFGDGGTSTLQNPSHTYAAPGTYNVCLTVTNACGTTNTCIAVTVVCPNPVAMYSYAVLGNTVNFTIQSSSGVPATYSWDFGDGTTSTSFNPSHTYLTGGDFEVCLTVVDVCGTDTYCDTVSIFCPGPVADFNWSTVGFTVDFQDLSTNNPTQWAWDFGDGGFSTLQNPSHTYAAVGPYQVCLVAINNCDTNTNCKIVNDLVGVADPSRNIAIELFPNPATDLVTVKGLGQMAGTWRVEIIDMFGRQLILREANASSALVEEVSLRDLAAGMYLVKVTKGKSTKVIHLVKE